MLIQCIYFLKLGYIVNCFLVVVFKCVCVCVCENLVHVHARQSIDAIHGTHVSEVAIEASRARHAKVTVETRQAETVGRAIVAASAHLHGMNARHLLRIQIAAHGAHGAHRSHAAHVTLAAHLRLLVLLHSAHATLSHAAHVLIAALALAAHELVVAHLTALLATAAHALASAAEVLLAESVTDVQSIVLEHELLFFEREHFRRVRLVVVRDEAVAARVAALIRDDASVLHMSEMREVIAELILRCTLRNAADKNTVGDTIHAIIHFCC